MNIKQLCAKHSLMAAELFEKDNQDTACKGEQLSPPTDFIPIPELRLDRLEMLLELLRIDKLIGVNL